MDKEFLEWFNKYYRENWEVGPDTYSREEAKEIALAAWQAVQQGMEPTLDDLTREDRLSLKPDHWVRATGE